MTKWLLYMMIPIMLLQSNMTLVICTSFYYNQNYIEKYLCVQRNMKSNYCHGQCYLMKKLKEKQENEQKNFKVHFHEATLDMVKIIDLPKLSITNDENSLKHPIYNNRIYIHDYSSLVFRPPIILA